MPDKANLDRLLILCFDKLGDKKFNEDTGLVQAFYRNVETFKLSEPFPEITYYFTFSALEILARCHQNHSKDKNVAKVLNDFLCAIGFTVHQDNPKQRRLGMQTYAHLRNALFHNGKFEATVPENGNSITLRLEDYNGNLERLLPDVLLRVIDYNDSSINWDRWSNRLLW